MQNLHQVYANFIHQFIQNAYCRYPAFAFYNNCQQIAQILFQTMAIKNYLFLFAVLVVTALTEEPNPGQPLLQTTRPQNFKPNSRSIIYPLGDDIDTLKLSPQSTGDSMQVDHLLREAPIKEALRQNQNSIFYYITALWHLFRGPNITSTSTPKLTPPTIPKTLISKNQIQDTSSTDQQQKHQTQRNLISSTTIQLVGEQKRLKILTSQLKETQQAISLPTLLHKNRKRKYFVFGTIVFGLVAMALVRVIKNKQEESQDFHRSGMLLPLEEAEAEQQ